MVSLGIRGDVERASNMGRETHIMPVVWEREPYEWKEKKYLWPVVAPKTGRVLRENIMIFKNSKSQNTTSFYDDFNKEQMNLKWNFRRVPMDNIFSLSDVPGFLRLFAFTEEIRERGRASLVGFNQTESDFEYSAKIKLNLKNNQTEVGIIIIQKDDNYISFNVKKNRDKLVLGLSVKESHKEKFVFKQENVELPENEILLKIISKNERYEFFYSNNENDSYKLFGSTTSNLVLSKGYTGAQLGLYATSNGKKYFDKGYADIDWVSYIPAPRKN
jgi:alpha-N-arabinofuranosidase